MAAPFSKHSSTLLSIHNLSRTTRPPHLIPTAPPAGSVNRFANLVASHVGVGRVLIFISVINFRFGYTANLLNASVWTELQEIVKQAQLAC
jgi:hypothetical protein